jgi:outer membrane biosynthesis protein TonB
VDFEGLIRQTSESVRSALEAAQRRAEEIVQEAEAEAERIRAAAEAKARERLDQVRQALEQLEAGLGGKSTPPESNPEPKAEPEQRKPEVPEPKPAPAKQAHGELSTDELIERVKEGGASSTPEVEPAAQNSNDGPRDDAGAARLVAMKLALDGTARDEARKQLAADYHVADLDSLLDEVYAKAGR